MIIIKLYLWKEPMVSAGLNLITLYGLFGQGGAKEAYNNLLM